MNRAAAATVRDAIANAAQLVKWEERSAGRDQAILSRLDDALRLLDRADVAARAVEVR
jgi:hypothetical protein